MYSSQRGRIGRFGYIRKKMSPKMKEIMIRIKKWNKIINPVKLKNPLIYILELRKFRAKAQSKDSKINP